MIMPDKLKTNWDYSTIRMSTHPILYSTIRNTTKFKHIKLYIKASIL